ncbi:hypothetical protein [Achromobacter xylosoxidans]|nr:hypothetical protein [Achromobacter xylosoxidans]
MIPARPARSTWPERRDSIHFKEVCMRSILLWLLGVPIPIIILLALFWH